jgi:hypothetical protein
LERQRRKGLGPNDYTVSVVVDPPTPARAMMDANMLTRLISGISLGQQR